MATICFKIANEHVFFKIYLCYFLILMPSFLVDLETIKKTLGAGGNVLLPVDTAGRVLELILILEQVSRGDAIFLGLVKYT